MSSSSSSSFQPSDEQVSAFLAFTGSADPSKAAQYIEMGGGNLEAAVSLYLEHNDSSGTSNTMNTSAANAASATGIPSGTAGMPSNMFGQGQEDDIRAPDATRTMRLMDDIHGHGVAGIPPHPMLGDIMDNIMSSNAFAQPDARHATNMAAARAAAMAAAASNRDSEHDDDDEYIMDEDDDDEVQHVQHAAPPTLQDMFAPPKHLIHAAGGFQGARAVARDSRRWLLVNLQRDSEFSCHALNRDVWRDELVENLVREGFIFWQSMDVAPDGQTYVERYNVQAFPHIAIIDPRTGRSMWSKEGWTQENPMSAERFAEIAMDFCSRHSFDKPPEAPRGSSSSSSNIVSDAAAIASLNHRPMTENEQLQQAMRASLKKDDDSDDDDDVEIVDAPPAAQAPPPEPTFLETLLQLDIGPPGDARIQLRMPNGKRLVHNFRNDSLVKYIYAFVAQSNHEQGDGGREFRLRVGFPPRDLVDNLEKTIEECGLSGESITIRWK